MVISFKEEVKYMPRETFVPRELESAVEIITEVMRAYIHLTRLRNWSEGPGFEPGPAAEDPFRSANHYFGYHLAIAAMLPLHHPPTNSSLKLTTDQT
jgi:hypothetical protein